jgi:glutathione S-transferase
VPNSHQPHLTIWGRANSVNVQKVLSCLCELDFAYQRIDAGMAFGRNHEPDYLAMNPNGRVPTLVDGDFVLWESNSIMRYLVLAHAPQSSLYPQAPRLRAGVDRWLDWTLSTLQPVERRVFWALIRTPVEARDMSAIQKDADAAAVEWRIVDAELAARNFVAADHFTLADIALGAYARRWCSAPMRGAGSASWASRNQGWRISNAGSRNSLTGRGSGNSSRRRCRDGLRPQAWIKSWNARTAQCRRSG